MSENPGAAPAGAPVGVDSLPAGEYAIVELFGHQTVVGKICEVDRFGTKMLALEPLFRGHLLPASFIGGAAIYRLTPCDRQVAWAKQPQQLYQLPGAIAATVPVAALPPGQLPLDLEGREIEDPYHTDWLEDCGEDSAAG